MKYESDANEPKRMTWDEIFDLLEVDFNRFPHLNDVQRNWCESLTFDIGDINHRIQLFMKKDDIPKSLLVRPHDLDNYTRTLFNISWDDYYIAARMSAKMKMGQIMTDWAKEGNSTALKVASIMAGLEEEEARERRHVTIVIDTKGGGTEEDEAGI